MPLEAESRLGGHTKISCFAINEICCSITDRFCSVGTQMISSSGSEESRGALQAPILHDLDPFYAPKNCPSPTQANYKKIRDPCFNVGTVVGGNFPAVAFQEQHVGRPRLLHWPCTHLLKLSLKCFAMIPAGQRASRQRAEGLVLLLVVPVSLQIASNNCWQSQILLPKHQEIDANPPFPKKALS